MIDLSSFLVLNVDDNAPNRYVKTRLLKSHGLRVVEASTGLEGLGIVRDRHPDLVLLDIRLPDISGIEVCEAIKRHPDTAKTLVLQTSALATATPDRIRALDAGADSFLVEPAEPEEVIAMVKALLRLRRAERDLATAKGEAEIANAAKSHFMASASHDLRQPMQAQRLFLSVLESKLTTPEQLGLAKKISESLDASELLLGSLMELSALETGRIELAIRMVDVGALVAHIAEETAVVAKEKGLRLRTRIRPACCRTDTVQLERIVRNLASNALRYTERGGILLALRRIRGEAVIEVWDTGVGIAEDELAHIFGDFYQVANAERNRRKGLGLGLAVVHRSADLLGHRVEVRSVAGKGSLFRIFLGRPAAAISPDGKDREQVEPALPAGATVLVVEDDPMQLAGLTMVLENIGLTVLTAADAQDALQMVAEAKPTMVITDLRLPGLLNGLDLVRQIRQSVGYCPAIVQTGDTDRVVASEVVSQDGVGLLHKPYNPDKLRAAIAVAMDKAPLEGV